jgi:hypothetical protein
MSHRLKLQLVTLALGTVRGRRSPHQPTGSKSLKGGHRGICLALQGGLRSQGVGDNQGLHDSIRGHAA